MKILFVEPYAFTLFAFRKELLDELIKNNHEVYLCVDCNESVFNEYSNKVKKIYDLKLNLKDVKLSKNAFVLRYYKRIIKEIKPDLILSFTIKPNIYCGLFAKRINMVANITGLGRTFDKKSMLHLIAVSLYRKSFKNVDCIFFQNKNSLEQFKLNKIPVNKYRIIPGSGVNIEKFKCNTKHSNSKTFLFASRPIKEKGFDLMLMAIPKIVDVHADSKFIFLVDNDEVCHNSELKRIIDLYPNNVVLSPRTSDMVSIYCNSSFLVSPSFYHEGISNVLLESLACKTPVITTNDNPGCMEVLVEGKTGYGVKSDDLDSLVEAILKACTTDDNKLNEMGDFGREFVSKHFNRNITVNEYMKIINYLEDKGDIHGF